jgi:hypothetical protein
VQQLLQLPRVQHRLQLLQLLEVHLVLLEIRRLLSLLLLPKAPLQVPAAVPAPVPVLLLL